MTTAIYSCDDHLDLRAVPPNCGRRGCHAPTPNAGRVSWSATTSWSGSATAATWVGAATRARPVSASSALNAIGRAGIDDDGYRAGNARVAARGPRPRRARGVRRLRAARHRAARSRIRRCRPRASRRGTTGPPTSSTPSRPTGSAPCRSCPSSSAQAAADELERCAGQGTPRRDHRRLRHGPR